LHYIPYIQEVNFWAWLWVEMLCCRNKQWHVQNKLPQLALRLLKTSSEVLLGALPASFGINPGPNAWH